MYSESTNPSVMVNKKEANILQKKQSYMKIWKKKILEDVFSPADWCG